MSLNKMERAALSHRVRGVVPTDEEPLISTYWLDAFRQDPSLPSPAMQATNLLNVVGQHVLDTGEPYQPDSSTAPRAGSPNLQVMHRLLRELVDREDLRNVGNRTRITRSGASETSDAYEPTLDGWELFEEERRGGAAGHYGFMALKFGDEKLDTLLESVIRPGIREATGYDVVDMRSVARAGIIDNLMRAQIRDSAFVLADLTHDNLGAYWEAGFAEGIGKPVIYLCEQAKFEETQTHFDTNHSTTVVWSLEDPDGFLRELIATVRRSLNLFPSALDDHTR
jgi:nucleoside 2-deoxyribosyltransferase